MKTKFKNYWQTHNITPEVGKYAEKLGLECTATGGGCDYVCRLFPPADRFGTYVQVTLSSNKDGLSPKTLSEPCSVQIHIGEAGTTWLEFDFDNARDAMKWMREMPIGAAQQLD